MALVNTGGQNITFKFNQEGLSKDFNKIYYKIITAGIYDGGELEKINNSSVRLHPLTCYVEDSVAELGVRVQTTENVTIEGVAEATPYIVIRFEWVEEEENYADFIAVDESSITTDDIIVGQAVYISGALQETFDYTRREVGEISRSNLGSQAEETTTDIDAYLYVQAKEPPTNKVLIKKGFVVKENGDVEYKEQQDSPTFNTTTLGRIDLLYINEDGDFAVMEGMDSATPVAPTFSGNEGYYVIAKITRGASAATITGDQITVYDLQKTVRLNTVNANTLDEKSVGNSSGNIALSNGDLNTNLNVFLLDGAALSTDGNMVSASDELVPTEKAIKTKLTSLGSSFITAFWSQVALYLSKYDTDKSQNFDNWSDAVNDNTHVAACENMFVSTHETEGTAGEVYVFTPKLWGNATDRRYNFAPASIGASDGFGKAVDCSLDYRVIVGAPNRSTDTGRVLIYRRQQEYDWTSWGDEQTLDGKSTNQLFGSAVAIVNEYCVVGAPGDASVGANGGIAYAYHRSGDSFWSDEATLVSSDLAAGDKFGTAVAITENYIAVGAPEADGGDGAVYVFHRTGEATWDSGYKISPTYSGGNFGSTVDLWEDGVSDYLIVGAPNDDTEGTEAGKVYSYLRTDTNEWTSTFSTTPSDITAGDHFGSYVSIYDKWMVVSAPNQTKTFAPSFYVNTELTRIFHLYYRTDTNSWRRIATPLLNYGSNKTLGLEAQITKSFLVHTVQDDESKYFITLS